MLRLLKAANPPVRWPVPQGGLRRLVCARVRGDGAAMTLQYGWRTAGALGLAALAFAGLAFDTLFLGFGRVPFACPYARRQAR